MLKRFLKNAPLFSRLTDEERQVIAAHMHLQRFHQGDVLFEQGAPATAMYVVRSGLLRLINVEDGRIIANLGPANLAGETDMILGLPYEVRGEAATDLDVWVLSRNDWLDIIETHPLIAIKVGSFLGQPIGDTKTYLTTLLQQSSLFEDVPVHVLEALAEQMQLETKQHGELVFQANAPARYAYTIGEGRVALVSINPNDTDPFRYAAQGDWIGVEAVLRGGTYGAVARADGDVQLWKIEREALLDLVERYPLLRDIFRRQQPEAETIDRIAARDALQQTNLFADLPLDVLDDVIRSLIVEHVEPDEVLASPQEPLNALCILHRGRLQVIEDGKVLAEYEEGSTFGENILLTGRPLTQTIRAVEASTLWCLPKETFERLMARHNELGSRVSFLLRSLLSEEQAASPEQQSFLRMFPLFFALDDEALAAIEATLRREVYPAGTLIYHQGEWPEAFYLVYEGEVRVTNSRGKVTIVRPGGFLGETALLTGSEHAETAQTITDVIVYAMPRPDFEAMLERHPHIALSLSRTLSARLQRLQKNETAPLLQDSESASPSARAASALVFDRESARLSTHLWDQAIEWFAYLSTGAKIRLVIVALLFFWLVGVVAPWLVVQRLEGESLNMRETPAVVFVETII